MRKLLLSEQPAAGFTLIEGLVTVSIIGIMSAIAIPGWLSLFNQQRLSQAQERVLAVLQDAQANAKRQNATLQACFQDDGNQVWSAFQSVSTNNTTINCSQAGNWQPLIGSSDSRLITISTASTLAPTGKINGSYYYGMQFTSKGLVDSGVGNPPQKITIAMRNQLNGSQSCVFVETLLGAVRTDKNANCNLSQ